MNVRRFSFAALLAVMTAVFTAAVLLSGCATLGSGEEGKKTDTGTEEWFYASFDNGQRAAYDAFRRASQDPFSEEPVPIVDAQGKTVDILSSDLGMIYQGFLYDHPEVFWLSQTFGYRVSRTNGEEEYADAVGVDPIPESADVLTAQKEAFEREADNMLTCTEGAADAKGKAALLYQLLTAETDYEEEALYDPSLLEDHTAFGAVVNKRAVCDGMALSYKYLLGRCGIRCIPIPGVSDGIPHVWNTVFWENAWHEADPAWDAASYGNNEAQYFDLTTEEMNKDHVREEAGIALLIPVSP